MHDMNLGLDEAPPRFDVTDCVLRLSVGAGFLILGLKKFDEASLWARIFAQIGWGDWFRYLTGVMQFAGGALLLVPRTAAIGAVLLGCTMIGAIFVHFFVIGTGIGGAILPAGVLAFIVAASRKYFVRKKSPIGAADQAPLA